jgi:NTE family protein
LEKRYQPCCRPTRKKTIALSAVRPSSAPHCCCKGGGALGACQAGVYEALSEAGIHPDWVAGISIGAVNSAIIAGNPPEKRVEGLRRFWERITSDAFGSWAQDFLTPLMKGDWVRGLMNQVSANSAMLSGAPSVR